MLLVAETATLLVASCGERLPSKGDALDRHVGMADAIEVAPEPAGGRQRVGCADLPEVARREVRLVGRVVADRGSDRDADARVVPQLAQPRGGRMPAQPRVGVERPAGVAGQRELRAQRGVPRVAGRREQAQRVRAAVHEDRDEHLLLAGGLRHRGLEGLRRQRPAGAVDGEREPCRAQQHRAPRQAGAGGRRHPRFDGRQAGAGARDGVLEHVRAREVGAVVSHQESWASGAVAMSWRSAFWRSARKSLTLIPAG